MKTQSPHKAFNPSIVQEIYQKLYAHFGPQQWWPAETPFEVIIGAILTQNTAWINVERAIAQLRKNNCLTLAALMAISEKKLAELIYSSGFFHQKARRLKTIATFIHTAYGGSLDQLFSEPLDRLREELLALKGLGPETVDSILLYAGSQPVFVIDAYTKRIFSRHRLIEDKASYESMQNYFMSQQDHHTQTFNECHALIVKTAKIYCKKTASCSGCPLQSIPSIYERDH